MSKNTRNRILLTAVAALLLVCVTVGGTLAWLTDVTTEVTNTFSPADIHIDLKETVDENLQLIPGKEYNKEPKVSVDGTLTNVDIWLFVEINEQVYVNNQLDANKVATTYLSYTHNTSGWTQGTGENGNGVPTNVWFREVAKNTTVEYSLLNTLADSTNEVKVNNLTADDVHNVSVKLDYKAYAIQKDGFATAGLAWDQVSTLAATDDGNLDNDTEGQAHRADPDHDAYTEIE